MTTSPSFAASNSFLANAVGTATQPWVAKPGATLSLPWIEMPSLVIRIMKGMGEP